MGFVAYRGWVRRLVGQLPIDLSITGRRAGLLRGICDRLFVHSDALASVPVMHSPLAVDLRNPSERLLYYAPRNLLRSYARTPLYELMRVIAQKPGARKVFLDIGANLGMYTLLARELGFEAVCYEPEPAHCEFLTRNQARFGKVRAVALSDAIGSADFFVNAVDNPGASSLVTAEGKLPRGDHDRVVQVQVSTLDREIEIGCFDPEQVRLIKIDVEGNEERTLHGMRGYLGRGDAAVVWCEVRGPGSGRGENNYIPIVKFMAQFGYRAYSADRGTVHPFDPAEPPPQVFDLLFQVPHRHGVGPFADAV